MSLSPVAQSEKPFDAANVIVNRRGGDAAERSAVGEVTERRYDPANVDPG